MLRPRKVFGRVRFSLRAADGSETHYILELRKDGLHLRQRRCRRSAHLTLAQLKDVFSRQLLLPL